MIFLYLLVLSAITVFNLPQAFPEYFSGTIVRGWDADNHFYPNIFLLVRETSGYLAFGLAVGFAVGFVGGFSGGLARGLAFGLAVGLTFGLAVGLAGVLAGGLTFGLTFGLAFFLAWFRVIFYPVHWLINLKACRLDRNSYLWDALVWLPIPFAEKKLEDHAWQEPGLGFQFVQFLLEHRPFQRSLAFRLIHTATAATWFYSPLKLKQLIGPDIEETAEPELPSSTKNNFLLNFERSRIAKKRLSFSPTAKWTEYLKRIKSELASARQHNHNRLKKESWDRFHESLKEFEKITLLQSDRWKHDYLRAIRRWIEESEKEQQALEMSLKKTESISANFFRRGEALNPENFGPQPFFGRNDLKDELAFRVLSSGNMPMFLLQGQRRVGKTSLLNFLQILLGTGFLVIKQDMQSDEFGSVSDVFNGFLTKCRKELQNNGDENGQIPEGAMAAWKHFRTFIEEAVQTEKRKIILAFDEYENFHKLVRAEGENGERLIAAMRAFSQEQNSVVFLFTGLHLFADLGEPDFGRHFVQTHRLKVDYLKPEDARTLITEPYPDFNITYPPEVVDAMIQLTKGHPALLQHICHELVTRANIESRRSMNRDDLNHVLEESVLDRSNEVMGRFWVDFCRHDTAATMQQTVWEIMETGKTENQRDCGRLLDYGFIVRADDKFSLRVPLFEQWIKRHGKSF